MPDENTKIQLQGIRAQITAMSDTIHQRMNDFHENDEVLHNRLEKTLDATLVQVKTTNNRVTVLEKGKIIEEYKIKELNEKVGHLNKNTKIVQFIHKYPRVTTLLAFASILLFIKDFRIIIFDLVEDWYQIIKLLFI